MSGVSPTPGDILLAAGTIASTSIIAVIGFLIRRMISSIEDKIDDQGTDFARVVGRLGAEHDELHRRVDAFERRITRLESWRDLLYSTTHIQRKEKSDGDSPNDVL